MPTRRYELASRIASTHGREHASITADLLVRVAARDANDLYRVAGQVLATHGVERTETALVMRSVVDYRVAPLLHRMSG